MKELINKNKKIYKLSKFKKQRDDLFFVTLPRENAPAFITYLRDYEKFTHLNFISAVDYLENDIFQITYMLQNNESFVNLGVRVEIPRDNAEMTTIHHLWKAADVYERELKEMFGISFPGSPRQDESFVLEGWQDIPPMRRDFDTLKYSNETFFQRPGRTTHDPKTYMKEKLYPDNKPKKVKISKKQEGKDGKK
jgi:NADH-quinone oxidoreductase subunit C